MKLTFIIPAFNEENTIERTIEKVQRVEIFDWKKEIIVVDDCSTDKTVAKLAKFQGKSGVKIFTHRKNRGKGSAIRTGLAAASGSYIIIQDADHEYFPDDISAMVLVAKYNPRTAVYGSRFRGKHEDTVFGHKIANIFLTWLTNIFFGSELSDMETCYKLIPAAILKKIKLTCRSFDFEPEVTAKLLKNHVDILEVPIRYRKRGFTQGKKIRWQDGLIAIWTLIINRI